MRKALAGQWPAATRLIDDQALQSLGAAGNGSACSRRVTEDGDGDGECL